MSELSGVVYNEKVPKQSLEVHRSNCGEAVKVHQNISHRMTCQKDKT